MKFQEKLIPVVSEGGRERGGQEQFFGLDEFPFPQEPGVEGRETGIPHRKRRGKLVADPFGPGQIGPLCPKGDSSLRKEGKEKGEEKREKDDRPEHLGQILEAPAVRHP